MSPASPQRSVDTVPILLVDDRPANLVALTAILEGEGYRLVCAESGEQALNQVMHHDFALILMDVAMPGLDGIETAALIKQREHSSHTPIIFVTALMKEVETISKSYATGGVDYLIKPLDPAAVRAKVGVFVDLFRERRRARRRSHKVQKDLKAVLHASAVVSDAVAGLPESSIRMVMKTVALQAQSITRAEYTAIGVGTDPEQPFDPWIFVGVDEEVAQAIGRSPRPVGVLGLAAQQNNVVRIRDLRRHETHRGLPPNHPAMSSFLAAPIRCRGVSIGSIYVANKRGAAEFTAHDARVVTMLATKVGLAIETARMYRAAGQERAWLELVIDQMPEGVVVLDAKGHMTAKNQWMLGLAPPEFNEVDPFGNPLGFDVWRPSGERVPASSLPNVIALLKHTSILSEEFILRRMDGKRFPVLVSAAAIRTREGEIAGATMSIRDISHLRALERRRKEWTAIVAHDLRQPISTIALSAQALEGAVTKDSLRKTIARISTAARTLNAMIDDLLDASCVDARQLTLRRREVDLVALTRAVVEQRREVSSSPCEVSAVPEEQPPVWADPARIEQVLMNLLSNADKYGEPGAPVEIVVGGKNGEEEVVVTNHGGGIPAPELPIVFERFTRTAEARTGRPGGLGLGLYICKGLVEAHGGRIWVESPPGKVSFHFTLPRQKSG